MAQSGRTHLCPFICVRPNTSYLTLRLSLLASFCPAAVLTLLITFSVAPGGLRAEEQTFKRIQHRTKQGLIEGVVSADGKVRTYKGVPFAAAPVGALRWKPPQPAPAWTGVRPAIEYGPRPMQGRIYDDMVFRDAGPSEDCLYLNIWIPEELPRTKLPVMVWIFGGGFNAGSTSEPRQDGGNLCKKGVIVVSMNYRLGIFGFMAHPELTQESEHQASGNYGLMDQIAALAWVRDNIAGFGGDPNNVTLFGESAGATSVSAVMASPQGRNLIHRAIGQSGSILENPPLKTLADAETLAVAFTISRLGTSSLPALRAMSAREILDATLEAPRPRFRPITDGFVLPASSLSLYSSGHQAHVPLLAGFTRDEGRYSSFFEGQPATLINYIAEAKKRFGTEADTFLKLYSAQTDAEARRAAQDYAGDRSTGNRVWKLLELHRSTGKAPVYRFRFDQTLPLTPGAPLDAEPLAPHAADIEFVFRVLSARDLPWRPEDHELSELMASYWANFAKRGNPNGSGLPLWPQYNEASGFSVMHLGTPAQATPDADRARYEFIDRVQR